MSKHSIKPTEKPGFLFKYHPLNIHLVELMTQAEFYLSSKSELNDPLDSAYTIDQEDYMRLYFEKYPHLANDNESIERVKWLFEKRLENFASDWTSGIDDLTSRMRVACFTEDGDNSLMWSHYANNHSGVCLKFDLARDDNFKKSVQPVKYRNKLVEIKKLSDLKRCLLTKLTTWKSEREWRIVSDKPRFRFKQEALVEILFGLRVSDRTINWFKSFSENVYYGHAPLYRLKLRGNKLVKIDEYDELVPS
jgi:hypothetical protein